MTGTDDGEGERYRIVQLERKNTGVHTIGTSEREVGRGCLTSTQTRQRGGNGPICLVPTRPDAGVFIADGIYMRQVHYGKTGELKRVKESTNGARGRKASYKQYGPSRPMGFPNPSPTSERFEGGASPMEDVCAGDADETSRPTSRVIREQSIRGKRRS
jgi:hypothetical protein